MKKRIASFIFAMALMVSGFSMSALTFAESASADSINRHELSTGVQNIVKRARQITNIEWTPKTDITGWNEEVTYKAGVTYTGLPYGQPVYASYVPWSTNLNGFLSAVNDPNSKMYTSHSTYEAIAPYYSCDCSAFVSWAWGLNSRHTTREIKNYATEISSTSYKDAEVGDCLCYAGVHVVLITDITYDENDNINGIEISESAADSSANCCCKITWYGSGYTNSLAQLQAKYLNSGYILYRSNTRESVNYIHSCASPLQGDECALCELKNSDVFSVYAKITINDVTTLHSLPSVDSDKIGELYKGSEWTIDAYTVDESGDTWYRCESGEWMKADSVSVVEYLASATITGKSFPSGDLPKGKVFVVMGNVLAKNPIKSICAEIYRGTSANGIPEQKKTVTLAEASSYSLASSEIDNAMLFNELPDGNYTFKLTVVEQPNCVGGDKQSDIITTETSSFSIVSNKQTEKSCHIGIDVSHHQNAIDWDAVNPQIDFAIIRCGFGDDMTSQDDRYWQKNVEACERLGIPYGVYIYSYALTDEQALSEADHVIRLLKGHTPSLPVYLDLEDSSISTLSNAVLLRHTELFCDKVKAAGYETGVYSSLSWWKTKLADDSYDAWSRWVAVWGVSTPGYNKSYDVWQFTDSGSIDGVGGPVDMNYWYGDLPTAGGSQPAECDHDFQMCSCSEATCTECGYITYACTVCGDSYSETLQPTGHDYASTTVSATCEHGGYTRHICSLCGDTYDDNVTNKTDHVYQTGSCIYCGIEETSVAAGDINGDGDVTSADSVMLARYLSDLTTLNEEQLLAADVNDDGDVTSADSVMLARYLAGITTNLG